MHPLRSFQVIRLRIRVIGLKIPVLGDYSSNMQIGSDHPSDWIQDPSAWSHGRIVDPTILVIGCNRK